ncbi:hypothetical protein C2G38_2218982 [Gigaspora rosea]|uniref:Uncharacterized protein n=1 Tax=Gigaspora rosea TaxID=44941 RepID=A0A397U652_9GLOM|nr:hypothetical protein C2G38_2218982 [Gigaspora rosea]
MTLESTPNTVCTINLIQEPEDIENVDYKNLLIHYGEWTEFFLVLFPAVVVVAVV